MYFGYVMVMYWKALQKWALQKLNESSLKALRKLSENSTKAGSTNALWKLYESSLKALRKLSESSLKTHWKLYKSSLNAISPKAGWFLLEALQKQADLADFR